MHVRELPIGAAIEDLPPHDETFSAELGDGLVFISGFATQTALLLARQMPLQIRWPCTFLSITDGDRFASVALHDRSANACTIQFCAGGLPVNRKLLRIMLENAIELHLWGITELRTLALAGDVRGRKRLTHLGFTSAGDDPSRDEWFSVATANFLSSTLRRGVRRSMQ